MELEAELESVPELPSEGMLDALGELVAVPEPGAEVARGETECSEVARDNAEGEAGTEALPFCAEGEEESEGEAVLLVCGD